MIGNVFSILDVLRAERKDGGGGREVPYLRDEVFLRRVSWSFWQDVLNSIVYDHLVSPLVAS